MNSTVAYIIAEIAKSTPLLAIDLVRILAMPEATDADWDATRARWTPSWQEKKSAAEARAASSTT